jgi:hypothetical protein
VLEVFPTGGMLWHYRYRLNGKQERVTLGRYPALSLKLARAERDKRETLVAQGQSPAVQKRLAKQGAAPDTTVAEFGERFFRDVVARPQRASGSAFRYSCSSWKGLFLRAPPPRGANAGSGSSSSRPAGATTTGMFGAACRVTGKVRSPTLRGAVARTSV